MKFGKKAYICICLIPVLVSGVWRGEEKYIALPKSEEISQEELFNPDKIIDLELSLSLSDFEALSAQSRDLDRMLSGDCVSKPFPNPYTYFPTDLVINNRVFRRNIRVRKNGFVGSLSTTKPSLKIDLKNSNNSEPQTIAGVKQLYINNSRQDPSFIRACLAYKLFENAGLVVPKCNFVNLHVSGKNHGIFVDVESIDSDFVKRRFLNDDGDLFEGNVSDFRPELAGTFKKITNQSEIGAKSIDALVVALTSDESQLIVELEKVIDLDNFFTLWAMEVLINQMDGYSNNINNFFLYHQKSTGKSIFIPFDPELAFYESNPIPVSSNPPISVFASGILSRRLYLNPEGRQRYLNKLNQLLQTVFNENEISLEIDKMESLLSNYGAVNEEGIKSVRNFIYGQRAKITEELAKGPVDWSYPLKVKPCKSF